MMFILTVDPSISRIREQVHQNWKKLSEKSSHSQDNMPPTLTDSGHAKLQTEDHVEFFPFEPTNGVGILSDLQILPTHSKNKTTSVHQPEMIQIRASSEHQLASETNEHCRNLPIRRLFPSPWGPPIRTHLSLHKWFLAWHSSLTWPANTNNAKRTAPSLMPINRSIRKPPKSDSTTLGHEYHE